MRKHLRRRGVSLTPKGAERLYATMREAERLHRTGGRFTVEQLSELTGLGAQTVSRVLNGERRVDRRTLESVFRTFALRLEADDYVGDATQDEPSAPTVDWDGAVDVTIFCGRTEELGTLERWVHTDRCRVVALLGLGGIGKTSLASQFARSAQDRFERVVWRSLRDAPPPARLMGELLGALSDELGIVPSVGQLLERLRAWRSLIVLDNFEAVMCGGACAGRYRSGYEGYGELLRRVGEEMHGSCLLLTGREKPREVGLLQGEALGVRALHLGGLKEADGREVLRMKGLDLGSAAAEQWATLVRHYGGNPLILKMAANAILDLFGGDVGAFLEQKVMVFGDIRDVLAQQFDRLTPPEEEVLYWLAVNREPVSIEELGGDIVAPLPRARLLETLESLLRRSLVERCAARFTLQPVVMEYAGERLAEAASVEIANQRLELLDRHALIKSRSEDHVREAQERLIVEPVLQRLLAALGSRTGIEESLGRLLAAQRKRPPGYAAGNILNLLRCLGTELGGRDFSDLTIWQADLRSVDLEGASFARTDLSKSDFAEATGGVNSIAFSPDGKIWAVGDANSSVHMHDARDGRRLASFQGHTGRVWSVAFSPDGCRLASVGNDGVLKLWDVRDGRCLAHVAAHEGGAHAVAFSPDGQTLATAGDDRFARLWDATSGIPRGTLVGHADGIYAIAFAPDGRTLATGSDDRTVKLWQVNGGTCARTLSDHSGRIHTIAFSPDGQTLATGSDDRTAKLWNWATGQCRGTLLGHADWVRCVAFSPDGRLLATGSNDKTIRFWDVSTGAHLRTLWAHANWVSAVCFSPDSSRLASAGYDRTLKLWDVQAGCCLRTLRGHGSGFWAVAFSADGRTLAAGGNHHRVCLWETQTGRSVGFLSGHADWILSLAFDPDACLLAGAAGDGTVWLWNYRTGRCLLKLAGHTGRVWAVAWPKLPGSEGGIPGLLATAGSDGTVRLWDCRTGQCLRILDGHTSWVHAVVFAGMLARPVLASGGDDHAIRLWDPFTGECRGVLKGHTHRVFGLACSADGALLASASADKTIRLWDVSTGTHLQTLCAHTNWVSAVCFSPDGNWLASAGYDRTLKLWDLDRGGTPRTLTGHTDRVRSVAFSPSGRLLASASEDQTVKLWDAQSGECLSTLYGKRLYEGLDFSGAVGLSEAQRSSLKALGAVD